MKKVARHGISLLLYYIRFLRKEAATIVDKANDTQPIRAFSAFLLKLNNFKLRKTIFRKKMIYFVFKTKSLIADYTNIYI